MYGNSLLHEQFQGIYEELYKTALDNFFLAVVMYDREGYLIYANHMAQSIFKLRNDNVSHHIHCSHLIETSWQDLRKVVETGEPQTGLYIEMNNVTLQCNRIPLRQGDRIIGVMSSFHPMTEYENTILRLKEDKELLRRVEAVIESSYDGIYVTDGQGTTIMVNSAYEKITGIQRHEVVGRNMRDLVREGFFNESVTLKVLDTGKRQSLRQKLRTGKEILVTGNPLFDDEGNIIMVVTNDRDMTELMRLHQRLEDSLGMAMAYKEKLRALQQSTLFGKDFVVVSKPMCDVCDLVARVSKTDATVLFYGETGVGKDRLAEEVHTRSLRYNKGLFIKINCGAIPETLLESELFGYEGGAFTGARKEGKIGLFEVANGGTIFLDEVESLPLTLQPKLLRALQNFEITRIGGTVPKKVDVRVICATNQDLKEMVDRNQFRADLYYRLNVVSVGIPPLRERQDDIPYLITFFTHHFNQKYKKRKTITNEAMNSLLAYSWPGNVRELANVIERLTVVTENRQIGLQDLPLEIIGGQKGIPDIEYGLTLKEHIAREEILIIENAIRKYGSARKAAAALGIDHTTITRKLQKHHRRDS